MPQFDDSKFQRLLRLLTKIESSKRHCKVEIDFDGHKFRWRVTFGGLEASEFNLAQQHPPAETRD